MRHGHRVPRRAFLRTAGGLAVGLGLAGCTTSSDVPVITPANSDGGSGDTAGDGRPSDSVYVSPHVHERAVAGTTTTGDVTFGLAYSVPDYFWTVDGESTRRVNPGEDDNVQLLAGVWDSDSRMVLPDLDLTATILKDGDTVAETSLDPLLNQRWGLVFVANLALERYGELQVRLDASPGEVRRTGAFRDALADGASAEVAFDFDRTEVQNLATLYPPTAESPGAVEVLEDDELPVGRQPDPGTLPGEVLATGTSADAAFTVSAVPGDASPLDDGNPYLAVFAATPYNRLTLPRMRVEGRLVRDGEAVRDGQLPRTLDPEVGYHYGASVDGVERGDELVLSFPTAPQVGRYEGYERAFRSPPDLELTL